jgi:molybdate transport system substrate-binding protein
MWLIVFLWLLGVGPAGGDPGRAPLLVSAAVSLTEGLSECGSAFNEKTGIPVRFNFGPSNALARQIVQGAPVDVFISADRPQMELAVRSGAISPQTVTAVATNHLVIIVPAGSARPWSSPAALASSQIRHVAVGDPNAVPAGVYAKDWLQRINLWRAVEPKLVPATSVRGALSAVRTSAVDAGIVYRTDARALDGISIVYEVTGSDAPRIEYPAAIVTGSRRGVEASSFVEFLQSPPAQRILERWGFGTHVVATRNGH